MSLPTEINLPIIDDYKENREEYIEDLIYELKDMYENIVNDVNGFIRNSSEIDQSQWVPTLQGSNPGTFTYVHQVGWSIRQGIFTQLFFDVKWSASTATGNFYLELPYKVTLSDEKPFVGVVQHSQINLGAYDNVVIVAIPDTYRGEFWVTASNLGSGNLAVPNSFSRIAGHIYYIGVEDE